MSDSQGVKEFLELDLLFHLGAYENAKTHVLGELVTRLWNTTQPYRRAYTQLGGNRNRRIFHDEHHMLVTALYDGDLKLA